MNVKLSPSQGAQCVKRRITKCLGIPARANFIVFSPTVKASHHADEGAAVNIGRKFFKDRVDVKLTLEKINS